MSILMPKPSSPGGLSRGPDQLKIAVLCHSGAGGSGVVATELGLEVARAGNKVHFVGSSVPFRLQGMGGANGPYFHRPARSPTPCSISRFPS